MKTIVVSCDLPGGVNLELWRHDEVTKVMGEITPITLSIEVPTHPVFNAVAATQTQLLSLVDKIAAELRRMEASTPKPAPSPPPTRDFRGGGLTFDELVVALRNLNYDLTCGRCAMKFYGGTSCPPHDPTCQTDERDEWFEPSPACQTEESHSEPPTAIQCPTCGSTNPKEWSVVQYGGQSYPCPNKTFHLPNAK